MNVKQSLKWKSLVYTNAAHFIFIALAFLFSRVHLTNAWPVNKPDSAVDVLFRK